MNTEMIARTDSINSILAARKALFRVNATTQENALELKSIVIDKWPVVHISAGFWNAADEEIADELEDIFFSKAVVCHLAEYLEKDSICRHILPKALSAEQIPDIRKNGLAFYKKLDLAFTFYVPIAEHSNTGETASICVTENLLARAGLDMKEAAACAARNIEAEAECRPLMDILGAHIENSDREDGFPLWVLCTPGRRYGAGTIFSKHLLQKVEEQLQTDRLVILPSSVEEVLILKDGDFDPKDMLGIVCEINGTMVRPEDKLTDNVYFFQDGKLCALV